MTNSSRILNSLLLILFSSPFLFAQSEELLKQQQEILDLINLPKATSKARAAGYKDADVKDIINLQKENKISSAESVDLLTEATISAKDGDKVDNFGLNVKRSVEEGKNGRELANEIKGKNEERKAEKERIAKEENDKRHAEMERAKKSSKKSKAALSKSKKKKKGEKAIKQSKKSKSKAVKSKKSSKKSKAKKSTAKKSTSKKKGKSKK